ncbi:type II toxin-antitoxin system VapC family toxin [Chelativorans xinjiangense]|uniref:type II toxin-antitoxin system VapC family toxin n=1 Tax=Chelativorans xinjiangense TaxID=2681485 RepID=UPI0013590A57|nr:type II toxin-antitoxin system VapC family toxin [Chelativorans xinjiangense]
MIVLDTNVISELHRPEPDAAVAAWLASVAVRDTYLCGPVVMEQTYGAERYFLKSGSTRYRDILRATLRQFQDRVLDFTAGTPEIAGRLRAQREAHGRALSIMDAMIAAICLAHGAALATRNTRDFEGLDLTLVNPFEAGA